MLDFLNLSSLKQHLEPFLEHDQISVVPNGLNPASLQTSVTTKQDSTINILFLSNLFKSKGYLDLLLAIPQITEEFRDIKFIFVGEWGSHEAEKEARHIVHNLNIQSYVDFLGPLYGKEKDKIHSVLLNRIWVSATISRLHLVSLS